MQRAIGDGRALHGAIRVAAAEPWAKMLLGARVTKSAESRTII
jgi:hypothetical protein